jgi:YVTN family beta-propeller protein
MTLMPKLFAASLAVAAVSIPATAQQAPVEMPGGRIDLPTSKQIVGVVPGSPQRLGSLAVSIAVSPDGRYVVTVNGGYGSYESDYDQSLAVMDTRTGKLVDFPDARTTMQSARQTLFSGLAFSPDGKTLYGSIASTQDPLGTRAGNTGSGVQVYSFVDGKVTPVRVLKLGLEPLAPGHKTLLGGSAGRGEPISDGTKGIPYPAAIATVGADKLLVADNLSDCVLLTSAATGEILQRFDLSENVVVPSVYPIALAVTKDGKRAFVGLWNASEVVELDLEKGKVARKLALLKNENPIRPGSHPDALALAPDGHTLYAALGNRDSVAAIDLAEGKFALKGFFDARLPGQSFYGAQPEALAVSADGSHLYVANMGSDAVAVIDTRKLTRQTVSKGMAEPIGFIPTEWLPMAVAVSGGKLYVATGKGTGTGPNNFPQRVSDSIKGSPRSRASFTYIATLLHGSLAAIDIKTAEEHLKSLTEETLVDNRMKAAEEKIAFANGGPSPIKHIIYIIRENRTYDQILGDLAVNGKPVGNGDPKLTMYGADITPNIHKLVKQFGVLDNFYDSAEVSGDGHVWSNTAIGTDYLERTWQINYRGGQRGYDYEGVVSQGIPLDQGFPDVNEPSSGYVWGNAEKHGLTHYNFGEYIATTFCTERGKSSAQLNSQEGPMLEGQPCSQRNEVKPGEKLPAVWGGEVSKWPWAIPLIATNTATKPELRGHFATESPDFNLRVPDQIRANVLIRHLAGWVEDRKNGKDTMPNYITMRLGNDHTAGTAPGGPTPKSSVADNDLAVGRIVEAVSHSPYWDDTAIFVIEDDAQNGADHVDAHRSLGVVVSKYAPHTQDGMPFVDSGFYSTVSMIRTMETLLGLPPMNNNDALSSMMSPLFTGPGDQPAYTADTSNASNNLIYTANPPGTRGGRESAMMDFTHPDRADAQKLNVILWQDAKGNAPIPAQLLEKRKKAKKDADDN